MNSLKNHRNKSVSWILGILFLLLSIFFVFQIISLSESSHGVFAKRLQQKVYQQDELLQKAKTDLMKAYDQWSVPSSVGIYVFNQDSLMYWNTNTLEPKLLRKRVEVGHDTIINLNAGDYLVTSTAHGSYSFYLFSLLNTTYPIENKYFVNKFQLIFGKHKVSFGAEQHPDAFSVYSRSGKLLSYCTIHRQATWGPSNLSLLMGSALLMLLCALLLLSRFLTSRYSDVKPTKRSRRSKIILLAFATLVMLVLAFVGFKQLFRYGFGKGFLIPSAMSLDYCFMALFIGTLVLAIFSLFVRWLLRPWLQKRNEFLVMLAQFVLWSILLTVIYDREYTRFENEQIQTLAQDLSQERDEKFEQSYQKFLFDIQHDTTFNALAFSNDIMEEVLVTYMQSFLLDSVMSQYNVASAICSMDQELFVQPYDIVTDCNDYFVEKIKANHGVSLGNGLYYVDYNSLDPNYMAIFTVASDDDTLSQRTLYLEFTKLVTPSGFGLPRMLRDDHNTLLLRSSVACYRDSVLVYKFGSYIYPNFLVDYKYPVNTFSYGTKLKHYVYQVDNSKVLAISADRKGWKEMTAPFVVFFGLLLVLYLLFYFVGGINQGNPTARNLSNRFQMLVLVALGISFLLIGPVSVLYLRSLYTQKANETHFDRIRTLSLDITSEVDFSFLQQPGFKTMLDDILRRYSETFFTDINVYDVNGKLLATTSPELTELQLQTTLMNAEAFHNMQGERSLYYIHEEKLGNAVYQSSYISIQDHTGKTVAYLNIPYFSSQSDLRTEILYYLLTYINIILLIIFISLPIVLIITRRVTDPLVRLQVKMRAVDINKANEQLEWKSNDEIGALINQYNQLIVALEKSAAELKRTTTESAWRGVARQVAHEIKNSLTPMRLSVQLLQRNIESGSATPEQMQRTTATLIEQIDALSDIASSFSTYAKLPENHPQPLDLAELVGNVVNLYDNAENIEFHYDYDPSKDHIFNGDKTNLNSAVGNIIKNATQAIGNKPDGRIDVSLRSTEKAFVISVKDNGKGIREEDKKMIFVPNFTTKTGGSGVGLSLTYNIVQSAHGTITFESQEGVGTEFVIHLPK